MNLPSPVNRGTATGWGRKTAEWPARNCCPSPLALWPCSLVPVRLHIFIIILGLGRKVLSGVHHLAYIQTTPNPTVLVVVWPEGYREHCCLLSPLFFPCMEPGPGAVPSGHWRERWGSLFWEALAPPAPQKKASPSRCPVCLSWVVGKDPAALWASWLQLTQSTGLVLFAF